MSISITRFTQVQENQDEESDFEILSETSMGSNDSFDDDEINYDDLESLFTKKIRPDVQNLILNDETVTPYMFSFLENCSSESLNSFLFHNRLFFLTFLSGNKGDRLLLLFNSKVLFQMNVYLLSTLPFLRDFYPNPYYLKNCPVDQDFYSRIEFFRRIWWIGEKYYIKKNDNIFFSDQKVKNILEFFNFVIMEKRIPNKRMPIGDYQMEPDTRVMED